MRDYVMICVCIYEPVLIHGMKNVLLFIIVT